MSFAAAIPPASIEFVLGLLLPVLLPGMGGDAAAARGLAIDMLLEHAPQTVRELRLAGEAIGHSLKGMTMLAASAEPGLAPAKHEAALKWATRLARSGHQAQGQLDALQRAPHRIRFSREAMLDADVPAPESVPASRPPPPPAATTEQQPAVPPTDLEQAEAKLRSAEKLLGLMKAHWKGAPPPHSKAAQDIQAQQRVVDTARMALVQARRRAADQAMPSPEQAAA